MIFNVSFVALVILLILGAIRHEATPSFERCLRDWPLAECQARKDAGALE